MDSCFNLTDYRDIDLYILRMESQSLTNAVLALLEGDNDPYDRLRVWLDVHCTIRLCGSVAKTLLIVTVNNNNNQSAISTSCLEHYTVEERTITRWKLEQSRASLPSPTAVVGHMQR